MAAHPLEDTDSPELVETFATPPLFEWQVYETETQAPSRKLLFWLGSVLIAIIGYALFLNSSIVAITFILIGLTGYLLLHRQARFLQCRIFDHGVSVNRELFPFENMDSFWIFDESTYPAFIRFRTHILIEPLVDIPLGDTAPETIRAILQPLLPEERSELTFVDILSRMLHI